ncbi:MAG TPA: trypsin-like peptidase domain-containing protein [Steroidobacteraceae bacterium]|jgi:S1-C subfamily serine protease|nr:trypsin-like peptidase domain-containing protein [Steroidobacteraceae bacterium]
MPALKRLLPASLFFCLVLCAAAASAANAHAAVPASIEDSVVKVFATLRYPDPFKPWTKQAPSEVTASGVVIEGNRILTNAHVVLYATQVQIQANAAGDKLPATVVAVAPGIDLAVLKLEDTSFFDSHPAIKRASELPQIKDTVLAYGFPTGGSSLSITKGIVSRIEFVPYNFPVSGLRIQVDAAINPGNSGGPAIAGDKMIGLAFSKLVGGDAQNIGYIIPNEEVDLFLKDIADGRYDGKPAMYDDLQTLENPALRAYLKLDKSIEGMVVHRPYKSAASYPLKEWDVITRIGDTPIDNQGMVKIGKELRVGFGYLIQKQARNGELPLTVVRAGKSLEVQLPVSAEHPTLVTDLHGEYPPYFIYGPLVFSKATWQMVTGIDSNLGMLRALGFMKSPLITRALDPPDADLEELVVVSSPFFPHKLANGYSNPAGAVVYAVNGTRIRSLKHLVAVLRDLKDPFVTFEFDQKGGEGLVFSRAEMVAATEGILADNGVRAQGSPDTLAVWQASPSSKQAAQ